MSAREDIDLLLKDHEVSSWVRQLVQAYMAGFAHELAEQVREADPHVPEGFSLRPEWLDVWNSAKADLADEIDPEVEK